MWEREERSNEMRREERKRKVEKRTKAGDGKGGSDIEQG